MSLATGLPAALLPSFAQAKGRVYKTDGWTPVTVWEGVSTSVLNAGIPITTETWSQAATTGAGSCTVGVHLLRYRYINTRTGYVSDPSNERSVTVATGQQKLTYDINTSDNTYIQNTSESKVDYIIVEMTQVGGDVFFEAARTANTAATTVDVNISDDDLAAVDIDYVDYGHEPPPRGAILMYHKGIMWVFGKSIWNTGTATVASADAKSVVMNSAAYLQLEAKNDRLMNLFGIAAEFSIASIDPSSRLVILDRPVGETLSGASYSFYPRVGRIGFFSQVNYPEGFDVGNRKIEFLAGRGESAIKAVKVCNNDIIVLGQHAGERFLYEDNPELGAHVPIPGNRGAFNLNSAVVVDDNTVYALDTMGPWRWRGGKPDDLAGQIFDTWDTVNVADTNLTFYSQVAFDSTTRKVWFFVYGTTHAFDAITYHVDEQSWDTVVFEGDRKVTCVCNVVDANGVPRLLCFDDNGHSWFLDCGTTDGANTGQTLELLVKTGSTATSIVRTTATPNWTSNVLKGAYAYSVARAEARLITANTTDTLTVEAFGGVPTTGSAVYIGRIHAILKTGMYRPKEKSDFMETPTLHCIFKEGITDADEQCEIRLYENGSATATTMGATYTSGYPWISKTAAGADISLLYTDSTANGHFIVPLISGWRKGLEVEFRVSQPRQSFYLRDFWLEGVSRDDTKKER